MNYVFQIRSGQPYNLTVGGDPAHISGNNGSVSGYSRPNVKGIRTREAAARLASVSGRPIRAIVSSIQRPLRFRRTRSAIWDVVF